LQQYKSPGGGHVPLGAASFQTAWRVSRTARRSAPQNSSRSRHRLAVLCSPPGAGHSVAHCYQAIAWRTQSRRQALYQYSSTPIESPVTCFHRSPLLAPNALLPN